MEEVHDNLVKIEQNFRELIMQQCCGLHLFDEYLKKHPDFEFPKITEVLLEPGAQDFITIPGLFGGFIYYLENIDDKPVLYAEQSSRMDYSSDDYVYFEITENGSRMLNGEERSAIAQEFRNLSGRSAERRKEELRK